MLVNFRCFDFYWSVLSGFWDDSWEVMGNSKQTLDNFFMEATSSSFLVPYSLYTSMRGRTKFVLFLDELSASLSLH